MPTSPIKPVRCAIYTRKSTEHGLELEFNSLDAQRDACEAYIKSQASQGWRALPQHYDDPAYSGGNLDRPALQQLLKDIDAGRVDVVVVYKIDRLTRSLADFAKLVVAFDAKAISFVAVTQQFNTTTSMGRLTLNILLSFAQFERELSSERVRDKVAASRRKGMWTGGTVPLGYGAENKKLIINPIEAKTVRTIFRRYLELKSFSKLVTDLDSKGIVTKSRQTKVAKFNGGIPFTYGPLAHFLKNRVYIGEIGYKEKWFPGEHAPIIDRKIFAAVQDLLKSNSTERKAYRASSKAILMGKLYDDRGNRMTPSFSTKNGIRYRFYVSSALLRGRKHQVGTVGRVAAQHIESKVLSAIAEMPSTSDGHTGGTPSSLESIKRITVHSDHVLITAIPTDAGTDNAADNTFRIPWSRSSASALSTILETDRAPPSYPDEAAIQSIARAHIWLRALQDGTYQSIEELAKVSRIHPKVIRLALRLAFLSPAINAAILVGHPSFQVSKLAEISKTPTLSWKQQNQTLI
jgi:site-specific DNA recombinase